MQVIVYVLLIFINKSQSFCLKGNSSQENTMEQKLHKDLQCGYFIPHSPKPNGTVYVYLTFMLKSFNFNSDEEYLSVNSWVYMSWNDERLKWNASDYDGINRTVLMSSSLWLPGLRLINIAFGDDYDRYFFDPCQLRSNGKILCILRTNYEARCSTKLTYWPYDIQKCSLEFGSWPREGTTVVFKFSERSSMLKSFYGGTWDVTNYAQKSDPNSKTQLKLTITLERQAMSLAAIIIYPSLILLILNLVLMTLDIRGNVRLGMLYFSLASHFLFLSELQSEIPKHSVDSPIIIMYYRGSLIITVTLILLTHVLGPISKRVDTRLSLVTINESVLGGRLRYFIWPRWDYDISKGTEEWTKFTNIINSFSIIVITSAYVGLYLAFMPK